MAAADPFIASERDATLWPQGSAERQQIEGQRGAARTRVYRVIAALNGIDIEKHVSPREGVEVPVLLPGETFSRLRSAIMNEGVFAAMASVVGEQEASTLLGDIAAL